MPETGVTVTGLRDFARALGRIDPRLRRSLGNAYWRMGTKYSDRAHQVIRSNAKGRGGTHGGTRYRPSRATTGVKISIGGNVRALGDEFGARRYRQFNPWKGNQWSDWPDGGVGYGIHEVIRGAEEEIKEDHLDAVEEALAEAFPEHG